MIKSWMFYLFSEETLPEVDTMVRADIQRTYDRYLDMVVINEAQGFDGVFFSEHHFGTINMSPSPHLMIAAASQRTKTLRLGVMGTVLPLHDARRVAEECGMLDYLTHGRLEIGIGPGAGPDEAIRGGYAPDEIRPRYHSGADLLDKYLANVRVTHQDAFYNLNDTAVLPGMLQSNPKVWISAMSKDSYIWAAKRGFKVCTSWMPQPMVNELSEIYRNAAEEAGQPSGPDQLGLRRRVFVAPTDSEAQDLADAALDPILNAVGRDIPAFEFSDDAINRMRAQPDDIIVGSPRKVAEQLTDQAMASGTGNILFFTDFRLFKHADLSRCHDLISREIIPALKAISV